MDQSNQPSSEKGEITIKELERLKFTGHPPTYIYTVDYQGNRIDMIWVGIGYYATNKVNPDAVLVVPDKEE